MEVLVLWVALIVFIFAIRKPLASGLFGSLDKRAEKIRTDLDDAQRMHEEAKALYADYEQKLHEGEKLVADIQEQSKESIRHLEEKMRKDFEGTLNRRMQSAQERIAQEENLAVKEIRDKASDLAVRTTRQILSEKMSAESAQSTIDNAIADIGRKIAS